MAVYNALRNPFGGYITDDESGRNVFIHKSAVESSGLGELHRGKELSIKLSKMGLADFEP